MFVVTVKQFNGSPERPAQADKNGNFPVYLKSHNGPIPERARVLSGTVAYRAGMDINKIYLVNIVETGENEYGKTYRHSVVGEISTVEFATNQGKFGVGKVTKEVAPNVAVTAGTDEDEDDDKTF